jgi:hypothetical protein
VALALGADNMVITWGDLGVRFGFYDESLGQVLSGGCD